MTRLQGLSEQFAVVLAIGLNQKKKRKVLLADEFSLKVHFEPLFKIVSKKAYKLQFGIFVSFFTVHHAFEGEIVLEGIFDQRARYVISIWRISE